MSAFESYVLNVE